MTDIQGIVNVPDLEQAKVTCTPVGEAYRYAITVPTVPALLRRRHDGEVEMHVYRARKERTGQP